jgi:hypothetical protein
MKKIILKLIRIYQKTFSPDHGFIFSGSAMKCRFYPSCSQYTYEAIENYGISKGVAKGLWRILKCNPLSKGGVDLSR